MAVLLYFLFYKTTRITKSTMFMSRYNSHSWTQYSMLLKLYRLINSVFKQGDNKQCAKTHVFKNFSKQLYCLYLLLTVRIWGRFYIYFKRAICLCHVDKTGASELAEYHMTANFRQLVKKTGRSYFMIIRNIPLEANEFRPKLLLIILRRKQQ